MYHKQLDSSFITDINGTDTSQPKGSIKWVHGYIYSYHS